MMRGCVCRWCGEAVTEADERYEAMDGTAVHAAYGGVPAGNGGGGGAGGASGV